MPVELCKFINLDELYIPFLDKSLALLAACQAKGVNYYLTTGYRSLQESGRLFAQGRTEPGPIVTHALPGQSFHNYGIAVDGCRDGDQKKSGLQPDWKDEDYRLWADEAGKLGLEAGFYWKSFPDRPHVQLPISKYGLDWRSLQKRFDSGGMPAVWSLLDMYQWG